MTTENNPLVSICIPTFNGEAYLKECLRSAINQTYKNIEIIVSDDASKDGTLQIINDIKSKTEIPIYIFKHQPNGIGANWNNCIKNANGQYLKFLFQDDVLNEDCVARMMKMMLLNSNIGIVYAKRHFIYQEETEAILEFKRVYGNLHQYWTNFKVKDGIISGKEYLKDRNFLNAPKNKIGEPTSVLLNKSCFKKVGYFNEDMKQALDVEYWSRLMPFYKIGFVDDVLTSFRLHDAQASAVNKAGKVNETEALYHIYYKTLLKYLHKDCRWKLLKKFHPILSRLLKLKTKFGKNA